MVQANPPASDAEFDEDFRPDERLFHYTSSHGLYGILESNCFWATHFRFLNDSSEFFAAKKSLTVFVEHEIRKKIAALKVSGVISLREGVSVKDISEHDAQKIVEGMYEATLNHADPFVFSSFVSDPQSKEFRDGLLLHWATYGRDGGYALEINPHKLAKLIRGRQENLLLQKAAYVRDVVPAELSNEYRIIGEVAQEMIEGLLAERFDEARIEKSGQAFMKVASLIKDAFFEGEREARIALLRLKVGIQAYTPKNVYIRHQQGRAIPYVKLFEGELTAEKSPIEAIIIGPHPDRERRLKALSLYLEAKGLTDIKVIQSNVPYLGG